MFGMVRSFCFVLLYCSFSCSMCERSASTWIVAFGCDEKCVWTCVCVCWSYPNWIVALGCYESRVWTCAFLCAWKRCSKQIGALWWKQYVNSLVFACKIPSIKDISLEIWWEQRVDVCICVSEKKKKISERLSRGALLLWWDTSFWTRIHLCVWRSHPKWILYGGLVLWPEYVWHFVQLLRACWDLAKGEKAAKLSVQIGTDFLPWEWVGSPE